MKRGREGEGEGGRVSNEDRLFVLADVQGERKGGREGEREGEGEGEWDLVLFAGSRDLVDGLALACRKVYSFFLFLHPLLSLLLFPHVFNNKFELDSRKFENPKGLFFLYIFNLYIPNPTEPYNCLATPLFLHILLSHFSLFCTHKNN